MSPTVLSVAYPFAPVAPETAGGAEQVLAMLDRGLCRAGWRSLVVACEGSSVDGTLIAVPRVRGELDEAAMEAVRERQARAIAAVLASHSVDLVHMHGIDFHTYLPPAGVPVLATLHLPLAWYPAEALHPVRPDTWLNCVSAAQHATAGDNPHLLPAVENGVELPAFRHRHARRGFALMLARLCPEKGVHLAIEAAKWAGVPLLIAGEVFPYPAHRAYVEAEVRPRLDGLRRWIGPVGPARKRPLLAAARCLLIPSVADETSSLVAREAAAAGTPVIAFRRGALPETVEDGRTGFLVEDVAGMAQAIRRSGDIDADTCRAVARRRFSAEDMLARYFRLYEAVITSRPLAGEGGAQPQAGKVRAAATTVRHPHPGPLPQAGEGVETAIIGDAASLAALEPEWWALWRRCPQATPFQSPAWLLAWWRAFAPGELSVAAVRVGGRLVGLAPFYLEDGCRLLPIGISLSDYLDVLVDPDHHEAAAVLVDALAAESRWREWELPELGPGAVASTLLLPAGCREEVGAPTPCAVLPLPAAIPKRQQRKSRMALHRARRRGAAEFVQADTASLDGLTAELLRLHALGWTRRGRPGGVLADGRVAAFLKMAAPGLHAAGVLRLYAVRIDGRTAGAYCGFVHGGRAYAYLGGFDPDFAFESPGTLLIAHAIDEAGREGAAELDFLRGHEPYKFEWGCVARSSRCRIFRRVEAHAAA